MAIIRCKCSCIYPDDMKICPSCGEPTESNALSKESTVYAAKIQQSPPKDWRPATTNSAHNYSTHKPRNISAINNGAMTNCTACKKDISKKAEVCPHCGQPTGVHVCPKCQSINTKVISGASKATSIFLWGPFAANKVVSKFQCRDCGHKW